MLPGVQAAPADAPSAYLHLAGSRPAVFYADYRRALAFLAEHIGADGREHQPAGPPASVVADAKAAVALAEAGHRPAAERLVNGLWAPWADVRSLSAALWAVTTIDNGTARLADHWSWTRMAVSRVLRATKTPNQLSPDTLALTAAAVRAAAGAAASRGDWWSAWWWSRHARSLARVICAEELQRSTSARDYVAGARWGLIPRLQAQRILAGLDHLGLIEPGFGLRAWPDPERGGFTVDAKTTFDYVEALSTNGLGAKAMGLYVAALQMVGTKGGVRRRLNPVIGRARGILLGGSGIGATAQYLLASEALVRRHQLGLGWRAAELTGMYGRWWTSDQRWWDPKVRFHSQRIAMYVQGGSGGEVFRGLMVLLARGWVPIAFWDRPWPGLPTRPGASLLRHWRQFAAVVVLRDGHFGRPSQPCWRALRRTGVRVVFRPPALDGELPAGGGQRPSRRAWLRLAGRLAASVHRNYRASVNGESIWLEANPSPDGPVWPAYLWPVSQWIAANQALAGIKRRPVPLSLMDSMHPYLLDRRPGSAGYTAAVDNPAGLQFYDDNGWVLLDDIEAFRLTHDTRWVQQARRVFAFMASGWDPREGGEWFNTERATRTETATGTFLLGAEELYATTHDSCYRRWALAIRNWNTKHMRTLIGLYGDHLSAVRPSHPSGVPFPYNSGLVIDADLQWYQIVGRSGVRDAERLADTVLEVWQDPVTGNLIQLNAEDPAEQDAFDAIFLASLVRLYQLDPNPRYQRAVLAEASQVVLAMAPNGLVGRDWSDPAEASSSCSLLTQASALSILVDAATIVRLPVNQPTKRRSIEPGQATKSRGKGPTMRRPIPAGYALQWHGRGTASNAGHLVSLCVLRRQCLAGIDTRAVRRAAAGTALTLER